MNLNLLNFKLARMISTSKAPIYDLLEKKIFLNVPPKILKNFPLFPTFFTENLVFFRYFAQRNPTQSLNQ